MQSILTRMILREIASLPHQSQYDLITTLRQEADRLEEALSHALVESALQRPCDCDPDHRPKAR